jgi:hypothetical protein
MVKEVHPVGIVIPKDHQAVAARDLDQEVITAETEEEAVALPGEDQNPDVHHQAVVDLHPCHVKK